LIPHGLSNRYATALLDAALKKGIAAQVEEDARALRQIIQDQPAYKTFLLSPQVLTSEKKAMIEKAFSKRASDLFVRFLNLLLDKKRFGLIEEIIEGYIILHERHQGIMEATVITAVPIDKALEEKVRKKLEAETDKTIRITTEVDPDIIAGMIIKLDGMIIDGSIKFRMETLRRQIEELRVY